jgi:hypothetical protein
MSGLELAYWLALGIGLAILSVSLVLGDVLDFFDIDIGDVGVPIVPVFFGAIAAFGAGGLIGVKAFGFGTGGSIALGLVGGVGAAGLVVLLFSMLGRQESKEGFELAKLVGERGRSVLAMGPGRTGRVSVQ